ncbi:hypothetical protein E4K10_45580 [Streptomyces sp. T1317-0309]|nr:hypothetical protein E4K10_45580 [Streptomyces sp. T1317-0309]
MDHRLLWAFTLEDDGRTRTLTTSGVRWNNRYYVGEWMSGGADAGTKVRCATCRITMTRSRCSTPPRVSTLGTAHLADGGHRRTAPRPAPQQGSGETTSGQGPGPSLSPYPLQVRGGDHGAATQATGLADRC